nr:putative GATA transcription factor 22 [Quercus suber]
MTPAYLNPPSSPCPLVEQREEDQHLKLFISPHDHQASSSLLVPTFFERKQHDEKGIKFEEPQLQEHDDEKSVEEDISKHHKLSICQSQGGDPSKSTTGPVQWMSSKMRLMQKMMNPNFQDTDKQRHGNGEINSPNCINNTIRVCADCNTTTTPLWRSGPRGPKSLCNACGIRQRKARRAMAEAAAAANGIVVSTNNSTTKSYKVHNKEKKSRKSHGAQYKTKCKLMDTSHSKRKLAFKDLALSLRNNSTFGSVFPQDEAEGALLLMELSCGLVHSKKFCI